MGRSNTGHALPLAGTGMVGQNRCQPGHHHRPGCPAIGLPLWPAPVPDQGNQPTRDCQSNTGTNQTANGNSQVIGH